MFDAIQVALAGHTESTAADGKGLTALIRLGEKKALVKLLIDGDEQRILECALSGTSHAVLVSQSGNRCMFPATV